MMAAKSQPSRKKSCSLTLQASFLLCATVIYIGVIGTQFKLARLIGNHDAYINSRGGFHYSLSGDPSVRREKATVKKVHMSEEELKSQYKVLATSTASKWNLTAPNAVELLEQQFTKEYDYNPDTDFFHFHHLYKSGGTSISDLIDNTLGLPKVGKWYDKILPGSYRSGDMNHKEALEDITRRLAQGTPREELPYRASYAHTGLRPVYGPQKTETGEFLLKHLPHKRLRGVTMLREPTDFRASNHAMIMCGLNAEVVKFNNERAKQGLEQICSPKEGLNISELIDRKIQTILDKCKDPNNVNAQQKKQCKDEESGIDTLDHCRSAAHLLASPKYDKHYRSMFKGLMGRFHRGQKFGGTAKGRMNYGFERAEESEGYSVEAVEEYTLEDLGGLDQTISAIGDIDSPEPDFIWFGITERMKESTSLFYYYFRVPPLEQVPDARVQSCRPTAWWSDMDKATVKEREPADYALWRAANAIMDVRIMKMQMEIQAKLDDGESKESMPHVDWDQLEEVGITFEL
jgi:hypothetical protein